MIFLKVEIAWQLASYANFSVVVRIFLGALFDFDIVLVNGGRLSDIVLCFF